MLGNSVLRNLKGDQVATVHVNSCQWVVGLGVLARRVEVLTAGWDARKVEPYAWSLIDGRDLLETAWIRREGR
jgi:hypothetical protein